VLELIANTGIPVNSALEGVWQVFLRFLLVCAGALLVVRLMGNRTVGQLSPFDFIMMVGIGDIIVSGAIDQRPTVVNCLTLLFVLLVLQQAMGYLAQKSLLLRKWFEGVPVVVIENGEIIKENIVKTQLNYDDLRQELHKQGMDMTSLKNIKVARLESGGYFSVIVKEDAAPLTKHDFEAYFKNISENPLSHGGEKWAKIEKLMQDVEYLTSYLKEQNKL
jgi:uncharacterized membrane protein YcaP (DUF421 family)